MRDALLAQNRTILYSLCEWGQADVEVWGNATGNSWRMSGDITPYWSRVAEILNENSFLLNSVNFWGHNDADMLEIGNGNLTLAESRSHFAFWAAMKSPLIIGTALNLLPADHVEILKNQFLLAFSQDEDFGGPATPYKWGTNPDWTFNATNPAEYWSGASTKGTLVMALNTLDVPAIRTIEWSEVPQLEKGCGSFEVTDVWSGKNLGCVEGGIKEEVGSHDTIAYLVGKKCSKGWWA
jgi:alpha-galactosidase